MFRNVPAGWTITIDNDPSWNGSVTGHAVVGAAALDASALSTMLTVSPPFSFVTGAPMSLSGTLTVMSNGEEKARTFPSIRMRPATP